MFEREMIDRLLKSANIVDVVRHYLPNSLVKKGKNYAAVCPFHDDHDPSLSINVELQIYKCFVCGHGGNAIRFVQEYEKCSFVEAVRKTAEIVGFHDPALTQGIQVTVDPEKRKLMDCISDLNSFAKYKAAMTQTDDAGNVSRTNLWYMARREIAGYSVMANPESADVKAPSANDVWPYYAEGDADHNAEHAKRYYKVNATTKTDTTTNRAPGETTVCMYWTLPKNGNANSNNLEDVTLHVEVTTEMGTEMTTVYSEYVLKTESFPTTNSSDETAHPTAYRLWRWSLKDRHN